MKLVIIGYVPATRGHPVVFLNNLRQFKTSAELVLFSDGNHPDIDIKIGNPEAFKGGMLNNEPNRFSVPNAVFFTALRMAKRMGATHMMFMEDDCRVLGDYWDRRIWEEAFSAPNPWIIAGSVVAYNPCNAGRESANKWTKLIQNNSRRNFPIPTYGWLGAAVPHPSSVFVNGAIGIYSVRWMGEFFDLENTMKAAQEHTAYDMAVGFQMWKRFDHHSYDLVCHLKSIYSGYGDVLTTPDERKAMLQNRDVVAVHQIKDDWTPNDDHA